MTENKVSDTLNVGTLTLFSQQTLFRHRGVMVVRGRVLVLASNSGPRAKFSTQCSYFGLRGNTKSLQLILAKIEEHTLVPIRHLPKCSHDILEHQIKENYLIGFCNF